MTAPLKSILRIPTGMDQYIALLSLESIVRQRLNKLLGGEKSHLGWEYAEHHTSVYVFTLSKRYTKNIEAALVHIIRSYLGTTFPVPPHPGQLVLAPATGYGGVLMPLQQNV